MKKSRLGIICSTDYVTYPMGGMMSFIVDVIPHLSSDFDITLWGVSADGRKVGEINLQGSVYPFKVFSTVRTERKIVPNILRVVYNLRGKVDEILREGYDILYFHGIPLSYPFLRKSLGRNYPKIVNHVHGITNPFSVSGNKLVQNPIVVSLYERYRKWVVENSDLVLLAADREGYETFIRKYDPSVAGKINYIPNFADTRVFSKTDKGQLREQLGLATRERIFINAGRLSPQKDPVLLVNSFACLKEELGIDAKLIVIGDGELRQKLEKLIGEKCLKPHVLLLGQLGRREIAKWLNAADVYVYTSQGNGFPIALVEATMCGLPIVTTDVTGVHDIVINGETGYLAEDRNPREVAAKMAAALDDHERLGKAALALSRGFTPDKIAANLIDALKKVAGAD